MKVNERAWEVRWNAASPDQRMRAFPSHCQADAIPFLTYTWRRLPRGVRQALMYDSNGTLKLPFGLPGVSNQVPPHRVSRQTTRIVTWRRERPLAVTLALLCVTLLVLQLLHQLWQIGLLLWSAL